MKLLFITQKLEGQDAFGVLWIHEFVRQGYEVDVIHLQGREGNEVIGGMNGASFQKYSLGKERGIHKFSQIMRYEYLITSLKYDRVFVHMAPIWVTLGFWWWTIRGIPFYLWYTHYKMQAGVRLTGWFGKRFFCAGPQSLPQYEGNPKKVVVGHGIDMAFWPKRANACKNPRRLLTVHRLSRSKRLEITLKALAQLPREYTLDIYGIEAEADYVAEMKALVASLTLESRVTFHGTIPMQQLPEIYIRHRLIVNMATDTIDKTMLEAMTCGCYPVVVAENAKAIGIEAAPAEDTPESLAAFILAHTDVPILTGDQLYGVVNSRHSLHGLVEKMGVYIGLGT